jgi:hypothetical protein
LNTLIKHKKSKRHRFQPFDSKTSASSVTAQMDAMDLNSQRDDDDNEDDDDNGNTNANGWDRPEDVRDCDVKRDPILAEKVGV